MDAQPTLFDSGTLTMHMEHGTIVNGDWVPYAPETTSTRHGWATPDDAVKHWRTLPSWNAYRNGRQTKTMQLEDGTQLIQRVWFETH
jgi:hypothetical protein